MKPKVKRNLKRYFGPPPPLTTGSVTGGAPTPVTLVIASAAESQHPSSSTPSGNRNAAFTEIVNRHAKSVEDNEPVRTSTTPAMPLSVFQNTH